jgi:hypothetical protein
MSFDSSLYGLNNNKGQDNPIIIARVTRIILDRIDINDTTNSDFAELGEWGALGCINFSILYSDKSSNNAKYSNLIAKPLFSNIKQYPLIGEIVQIIPGPSYNLNERKSNKEYYYTVPYNTWNSSHHNAFPDLVEYSNFIIDNKNTYNQTEQGNVQGASEEYQEYPLGKTFKEKNNIKDLLPFEGDVIIEGRWGQSIRFGSTVTDKNIINSWSKNGNDGDPITIIRNNQGNQSIQEGYVPTVENINVDGSSIYLTYNQSINIQDISKFPLNTFGIKIQISPDEIIPLQNNPTSYSTTSPSDQDIIELEQAKNSTIVNKS